MPCDAALPQPLPSAASTPGSGDNGLASNTPVAQMNSAAAAAASAASASSPAVTTTTKVAAVTTSPKKDYFARKSRAEMAFIVPLRKPRGELAPDATDPITGLPILHPKAMNLPMPPPTMDLIGNPEKWSFSLFPQEEEHTPNIYHVPNSIAPALLPMHLSSLTVPSMEKRRFCVATWASPEAAGPISDPKVAAFVAWLKRTTSTMTLPEVTASDTGGAAARTDQEEAHHTAVADHRRQLVSAYHAQLDANISLSLGPAFVRGVYAKRHFVPGDVVLEVPIDADPGNVASYGGLLTSERMRRCSRVAGRDDVKMPTFEQVYAAVNPPGQNEFTDEYHALFVDQIYMAIYMAVEKAALDASPLYPYLSLFPDPFFNDEGTVDEVHKEVVKPGVRLDFKAQIKTHRFTMHRVQQSWPAGGVAPSIADMIWGLRLVMSRQMLLPCVRHHVESLLPFAVQAEEEATADILTKAIRAGHRFLLFNILGALDVPRETGNDFDVRAAPCVVPLLDMIGHDPAGIAANIEMHMAGELGEDFGPAGNGRGSNDDGSTSSSGGRQDNRRLARSIVVRATEEIFPGQPLRRLFPRGYSLSYTMFRYGFLPLRHRDVDFLESARACGTLDRLPAVGETDLFGRNPLHRPKRFLESRLDGRPEEVVMLQGGDRAAPAGQLPST